MVDKNGAVVWSMVVQAFGKATVSLDSTITNNLRFSSQYFDEESGLHFNYHRYYNPILFRYQSRDPIGENGGINLYGFVVNNPVKYVDLNGLMSIRSLCCNGESYDSKMECCCEDGEIVKDSPKSGVKLSKTEMDSGIIRYIFWAPLNSKAGHSWWEWPIKDKNDPGSAGFNYMGCGAHMSPDLYANKKRRDKSKKHPLLVSPCKYNVKKLIECFRKRSTLKYFKDNYAPQYDCETYADILGKDCKKASKGCGGL